MALDRLLEALEARFDQPVIRSLIAAWRNHPLLWKELGYTDLPNDWLDHANNDLENGNLACFHSS